MGRTPRVVVAMSGGVDSSLAAALLVEQGYEVIGVMMRLWAEIATGVESSNKCCSIEAVSDARRVADQLEIPFYLINVEQPFKQKVVDFTVRSYLAGETPNPCIQCNRHIRFDYLYNYAMSLGADYLATGHYARVRPPAWASEQGPVNSEQGAVNGEQGAVNGEQSGGGDSISSLFTVHRSLFTDGWQLLAGLDSAKDQSYVLHVLTQQHLAHVLFPVGEYTKPVVRQMAAERGLPTASRHDSQDLCFLADGDYRRFLRDWSPPGTVRPGEIVDSAGRVLGEHQGLPFYTIGQRKGLGVAAGEPLYVLRLEPAENRVVVGPAHELGRQRLSAREVNWISGSPPAGPIEAQVKIRYKGRLAPAVVVPLSGGRVDVTLAEPLRDVTRGQGVVFYDGDVCLGGGLIE